MVARMTTGWKHGVMRLFRAMAKLRWVMSVREGEKGQPGETGRNKLGNDGGKQLMKQSKHKRNGGSFVGNRCGIDRRWINQDDR